MYHEQYYLVMGEFPELPPPAPTRQFLQRIHADGNTFTGDWWQAIRFRSAEAAQEHMLPGDILMVLSVSLSKA